jgi:hypothetical protein
MSYLLQLDVIIESGLLETEASSRPLFDDDICLQRMVNAGQLSELDKIQREKNEQFKQLLTAAEKYYFKNLARLEKLRKNAETHSKDLTNAEVKNTTFISF